MAEIFDEPRGLLPSRAMIASSSAGFTTSISMEGKVELRVC